MDDLNATFSEPDYYWKTLTAPPAYNYEVPIQLNDTEFLICPESKYSGSDGKNLFKYNIITNEWSEIMSYDEEIVMSYHTASFNAKTQILYVQTAEKTLIKMDLQNMKVVEIIEDLYDASFAASLMINGRFHVFGGWHTADAKHFVWDDLNKCYHTLHYFNDKPGAFNDHGTVYLQSTNRILVFGGSRATIYECSLNTMEWRESMTKWPVKFSKFCPGYVMTLNEKYVILLINNEIYVLNLDTMKFHKTTISTPCESSSGRRKCIIMNHKKNALLLVHGYVRQFWCLYSVDIIGVMLNYYSNEYLYVLQGSCSHWRIRVDDIINNIQSRQSVDQLAMLDDTHNDSDTFSD